MTLNTKAMVILDEFGRVCGVLNGVPKTLTVEDAMASCSDDVLMWWEGLRDFKDGESIDWPRHDPIYRAKA